MTFPFPFLSVGGRPKKNLEYLGTYTTTGSTSMNFSSVGLGVAAADRIIVIGVFARRSGIGLAFSSASVGAVDADLIAQRQSANASNSISCAVFAALVPTGVSADVGINAESAPGTTRIGVWSLTGTGGARAPADSVSNAMVGSSTLNLTAPNSGVGLLLSGVFVGGGGTGATSLGGIGSADDFNDILGITQTRFAGRHENDISGPVTGTVGASSGGTALVSNIAITW